MQEKNRFVAVEPYLIDVSEFTAERPSLAVPDSDVFDDVLDKVADDQVPAALSESTATSTTGHQAAPTTLKRPSAAKRDSAPRIAVAQPMPTTAELLALDASPSSNRASSRRATASRHNSLERARSPSATLELKAPTPAAVISRSARAHAAAPPRSGRCAAARSRLSPPSRSRCPSSPVCRKLPPSARRASSNRRPSATTATTGESDAFEFGDDEKPTAVSSSKKKAPPQAESRRRRRRRHRNH
jgi:hypothetical protein